MDYDSTLGMDVGLLHISPRETEFPGRILSIRAGRGRGAVVWLRGGGVARGGRGAGVVGRRAGRAVGWRGGLAGQGGGAAGDASVVRLDPVEVDGGTTL